MDKETEKMVDVYKDYEKLRIAKADICYIMSEGSHTKVYTKMQNYRSEKSLANWENILDESCFLRTHRSYIINLCMVKTFCDGYLYMVTGEKVLISRRKRKIFLENYDSCKKYIKEKV